MKISLNKIIKGSQPYLRTAQRVAAAANNAKNGQFGKSWNELEAIHKSGDLKKIRKGVKAVKKTKKDLKPKNIKANYKKEIAKLQKENFKGRAKAPVQEEEINDTRYVPPNEIEDSYDLLGLDDYF